MIPTPDEVTAFVRPLVLVVAIGLSAGVILGFAVALLYFGVQVLKSFWMSFKFVIGSSGRDSDTPSLG